MVEMRTRKKAQAEAAVAGKEFLPVVDREIESNNSIGKREPPS